MHKLVLCFIVMMVIQLAVSEDTGLGSNEPKVLKLFRSKRAWGCEGPFSKNEAKCEKHCKKNGRLALVIFGYPLIVTVSNKLSPEENKAHRK